MKKRFVLVGAIVVSSLVGATAFVLNLPKISPKSILTSVTREQAKLDQAWRLPVAATFKRQMTWQSNGSLCGPASVGNAFRSLGEHPASEAEGPRRDWPMLDWFLHPGSDAR